MLQEVTAGYSRLQEHRCRKGGAGGHLPPTFIAPHIPHSLFPAANAFGYMRLHALSARTIIYYPC